MATETFKILAQHAIAVATTNETLYTVPDKTQAVISSLTCCNTSGAARTIRIYTVKKGDTTAVGMALYYDLPIAATDTFILTGGVTLASGDFIVVYGSNTGLTFQAYGSEIARV